MAMNSRAAFACAALLAAMPLAAAQDAAPMSDAELIGDPAAGRELSRAACAECHGVAPGVFTSPVDGASPFATIARTPGMTSRAITVWLTTFHPDRTMPGILLEEGERRDVIAYILSLAQE